VTSRRDCEKAVGNIAVSQNATFLELECCILTCEMLYTVVLDYRGGTYTPQGQVNGDSGKVDRRVENCRSME
jgi:hypothetical protein